MMMTNPITPPTELVQQWKRTAPHILNDYEHYHYITLCAAQKLEACCKWLEQLEPARDFLAMQLRAANPSTLKQQALALVEQHEDGWRPSPKDWDTIRRALEALPE